MWENLRLQKAASFWVTSRDDVKCRVAHVSCHSSTMCPEPGQGAASLPAPAGARGVTGKMDLVGKGAQGRGRRAWGGGCCRAWCCWSQRDTKTNFLC